MSDYNTVKKRQHYVYRAYLDQWCEKNCEIHSLDLKTLEIITKKHTLETGVKNFFYRTKVDDIIYNMIIYKYSDLINTNNPKVCKFVSSLESLKDITEYRNQKHENYEKLEIFDKNFLENYYNEEIETIIDPILKKFKEIKHPIGQISLSPEDYCHLVLFIVSQAFRTKSSLHNISNIAKDLFLKYPDKEIKLTETQVDSFHKLCAVIDIWKYYKKMIDDKVHLKIYYNQTNLDFITSDQPVFIKKIKKDEFLYYFNFPLTPKFLIQVLPNKNSTLQVTYSFKPIKDKTKIIKINYTIYSNSYSYVYSNDRNTLEKYKIK